MINRSLRAEQMPPARLGWKHKNVVNHYPAHDCRGYRFRIDVVEIQYGEKHRAQKSEGRRDPFGPRDPVDHSLSRSGYKDKAPDGGVIITLLALFAIICAVVAVLYSRRL
jgi:hypothetical protein